ncbi:MAG: hypothetical protein ACOC3F_01445 [Desulfosudaceae bacterium]
MGTVLLAVDGMLPDRRILAYAMDICRRIRAELNILHIIAPQPGRGRLEKWKQQMHRARGCLERSMMAAAVDETGEHDTARELLDEAAAHIKRLLAEEEEPLVPYRVKIRAGATDMVIEDYLKRHREVVLAIYDTADHPEIPPDTAGPSQRLPVYPARRNIKAEELQKKLSVPLVVRRPDSFSKNKNENANKRRSP